MKLGLFFTSIDQTDAALLPLKDMGYAEWFTPAGSSAVMDNQTEYLASAELPESPDTRVAICSQVSPISAHYAGSNCQKLVSVAATTPSGFNALQANWEFYERSAKKAGLSPDRNNWYLLAPWHIAESRAEALRQVEAGCLNWIFRYPGIERMTRKSAHRVQTLVDCGFATIGTIEDAAARVEQLMEETGGFGGLLLLVHRWNNPEVFMDSAVRIADSVLSDAHRQSSADTNAQTSPHSRNLI